MRALQALSKVEQRWLRSLLHSRSYITAVLIAIGQLTKRVVGDEWGAKGQETLESDAYTRYRHRLRRFLIDSRARGGSIQGLHSPSRRIAEQDVDLKFVMESPIPDTWITGSGAVFYLSGWCFHLRSRITQIDFAVNDVIYAMKAQGMPRVDVSATFSKEDLRGYSLHSGFWTIVSVPGAQQATEARLALRVTLENVT